MSIFGKKRKASGTIAKDRLKLLLISDRVSCSPQTMQMLKNDMIKAAGKYIPVDAGKVTICFHQSPPVLTADRCDSWSRGDGCSFFDGLQLAVEFLLDHLRGKHYNAADRSVLRGFCRWCYPMAGSWLCTFSADRAFEDLADHVFCPVSDGSRRYPEYL